MAEIRKNRVKHKLERGEVATIIAGPNTPEMIDFFGPMGFDGMWIEGEHGPVDFADIPDATRACDLWGTTSVVRVNQNVPGVIYRALDLGAQGIAVPHVNTAAEARAVVKAAKYHPLGSRGLGPCRQGYGVEDFLDKANDETLVVILIEEVEGVKNLDEILTVDHIDVFFVGHVDLAQSMGLPGQTSHPDVVAATNNAIEQIVKAGRTAGALVDDSTVEENIKLGARWVMNGWAGWVEPDAKSYLDRVGRSSQGLGVGSR